MPPRKHIIERLGDKFTIGDGCWEWTAHKYPRGYGCLRPAAGQRSSTYAHVVVYEWLVGPIPAGLELDHLCRNTSCVKPTHLEPVTHRENVQRGRLVEVTRARKAAQTHCKHGHLLSGANLYRRPDNGRECRTCRAAQMRAFYERHGGG